MKKLCDLFVDVSGYLQCQRDGKVWIDFVVSNPDLVHKVKFSVEDKTTIFIVDAAKITMGKKEHFIISLADITEVENERKLFENAASLDALTGIANRLKFNTILEQQISFSKRYQEPFSLILFDIDDFKKVNDTYGHHVGDEVLIALAKHISKMIRQSDTFARWGGEEFGIILPQTPLVEAVELAHKIRRNINTLRFENGFGITSSFGVKTYEKETSRDLFFQATDKLLYQAKALGKNRVIG